ncbi:hypothetical protein [Ruminococcus flavefaciens]|uniref:hypothetical protein n=1 Tax=Ruminococcus flavefaciens TaxID=1265 RepID=UPI0026F2B797|nr:hypothetical protein [Ruminococcus flavefaciens]
MKKMSTSKKIVTILISVIIGLILGSIAGLAMTFSNKEYTSASDALTLIKVNCGTDYSILETGTLSSNDVYEDTYSNSYQAIMVKDFDEFTEYLKNKGCTEYKPQIMNRRYLSTADGKKFVLKQKRASDGVLWLFPYSIDLIEGVTMNDILSANS